LLKISIFNHPGRLNNSFALMKILAFAGSNSSTSINKKFVTYVTTLFDSQEIEILDLNDFEMPFYSSDREKNEGVPSKAIDFASKIDSSDLLLISLAEHNGAYSAAFKNIFDWVSRIKNRKAWGEKNIFLMSTSNGPRGGATVHEIAKNRFPINGGNIVASFILPKFAENFNDNDGVVEPALLEELKGLVSRLAQ
jgi:chromate reductase, NAD(P)H dehydrogenase (quinone)